jgi:prolyl-tRNA editing enzyme YbaK/EbsC (Cys-tRNA(Pro) deacylase)
MLNQLINRLSLQKADFEIVKHDIPIKSKKDALGYFKLEETVPTLIVQTEKGYYAIIISGERDKIDLEQIRLILEAEKIGFADRKDLITRFNFQPGGVPLIGHGLPCLMDNAIFKYQYVYGGTGDFYHTLKINPYDLKQANNVIAVFN